MTYTYADQCADMRYWLNYKMPGCADIINRMSHADMSVAIERGYDGGMERFIEVYGDTRTPVDDAHLDGQIALRRRLRDTLGRPYAVAACHVLIRVDTTDDRIKVVLRVIDEDQRATRLIQRSAVIRLLIFDRATTRLLPDECLEFKDYDWSSPEVYVNSHLRLMDPDRYTDKFWQYHECYRPGTERTPMDGCYGPTRKDSRHDEYREFISTIGA